MFLRDVGYYWNPMHWQFSDLKGLLSFQKLEFPLLENAVSSVYKMSKMKHFLLKNSGQWNQVDTISHSFQVRWTPGCVLRAHSPFFPLVFCYFHSHAGWCFVSHPKYKVWARTDVMCLGWLRKTTQKVAWCSVTIELPHSPVFWTSLVWGNKFVS